MDRRQARDDMGNKKIIKTKLIEIRYLIGEKLNNSIAKFFIIDYKLLLFF